MACFPARAGPRGRAGTTLVTCDAGSVGFRLKCAPGLSYLVVECDHADPDSHWGRATVDTFFLDTSWFDRP
jgi:hypothetical protein